MKRMERKKVKIAVSKTASQTYHRIGNHASASCFADGLQGCHGVAPGAA